MDYGDVEADYDTQRNTEGNESHGWELLITVVLALFIYMIFNGAV